MLQILIYLQIYLNYQMFLKADIVLSYLKALNPFKVGEPTFDYWSFAHKSRQHFSNSLRFQHSNALFPTPSWHPLARLWWWLKCTR